MGLLFSLLLSRATKVWFCFLGWSLLRKGMLCTEVYLPSIQVKENVTLMPLMVGFFFLSVGLGYAGVLEAKCSLKATFQKTISMLRVVFIMIMLDA